MNRKAKETKNSHRRKSKIPLSVQPAAGLSVRTILLHFHIFKNGGSTLDAALKKNLGGSWREIEGADPDGPLNWHMAIRLLKTEPKIKAVSSHTARFPPPSSPGFEFVPLFLIRHPIDRICSIYLHERRSSPHLPSQTAYVAQNAKLADYIRLALPNFPSVACDAQTSWLARACIYETPPNAADLAKAKSIIAKTLVPGVVERMDQYLMLLERELADHLPNLDLACPDENRNLERRPSLLARLREIRSMLPSQLWKELRERNRLDLEIWRFTHRLAQAKFSRMTDASKRLASFRHRKAKSGQPADLPWTGERLVASALGDFVGEHLHRYALALEFARQCDVLDVACGEGYGTAFLAKVSRSVIGVDCDTPTILHASAKYRARNLRFAAGRAEELPLPASSIDLVVSFETLEHLEDQDSMLREIKRVLRPGGRLLISTPNSKPYRTTSGKLNPFHVRELDLQGLRKLLSKYFQQINIGYQRSVSGSWIAPLDARPKSSAEYSGNFQQVTKIKPGADAPYLIALASDLPISALPSSLFNFTQELLLQLQASAQERSLERKSFSALKVEFEQRTAWAQSLESELQKTRADHTAQTRLVEERSAWALSLEQELRTAQVNFAKLSTEYAERTAWAKKLNTQLDAASGDNKRLQAEHAKTVAWAKSLERELHTAQANFAKLTTEYAERTAWAKSLESELDHTRVAFAAQQEHVLELAGLKKACTALSSILPVFPGTGEIALLDQCLLTIVDLRRDLAASKAEANAANGSSLDARLRAETMETEAKWLKVALADAQVHVDHLLIQTKSLQQCVNELGNDKQSAAEILRHCKEELNFAMAELHAIRMSLARYERKWICRIAARFSLSNPEDSP